MPTIRQSPDRSSGAATDSGRLRVPKRDIRLPGEHEKLVLENVSFRLDAGEKIALIGENGAGKTTIVKLLARLYDPTGGAILLDGVDLREY